MDISEKGFVSTRAGDVSDVPAIQVVARATWATAHAGIIPENVQRQLLGHEWTGDSRPMGVRLLTVAVERENAVGRRFYQRKGFAEVGERRVELHGHSMTFVECHRPI